MFLENNIFDVISLDLTDREKELLLRKLKQNLDTKCIEWTGHRNRKGYGMVRFRDHIGSLSHRVIYQIVHGNIPEGMLVCHSCDNPSCCFTFKTKEGNVGGHLFLGTPLDNSKDSGTKGRNRRLVGADNPNVKLTESQVIEIFQEYKNGADIEILAEKYGVSRQTIKNIVTGVNWNNVTGLERPIIEPRTFNTKEDLRKYLESNKVAEKDIIRFKKHISKTANGCNMWTGAPGDGYGSFSFKGFSLGAHQFAFVTKHNRLPDHDKEISHICATSLCVNPDHLVEATRQENMNNPITKARFSESREKMTCREEIPRNLIPMIRQRLALGETTTSLAQEYNVSDVTISNIGTGKSHKDLEGPIYESGTRNAAHGEKSGRSKTKASDIFNFRKRALSGETVADLARAENYSRNQMSNFVYGEGSWTHLDQNPSQYPDYIPPLVRTKTIAEKTPVTEELKLKVIELYNLNLTAGEMARNLNSTPKRINYVITNLQKEGKIQKKFKRTEVTEELLNKLKECFSNGLNPLQASVVTGLSQVTCEKKYTVFKKEKLNEKT